MSQSLIHESDLRQTADENAKLSEYIEQYAEHPQSVDYDFMNIVRNEHGVYASIGPHFQYAIFGRDSIETAEDLLETHESLAHTIIFELASRQGVTTDKKTEEEPGKILHEHRATEFEGKPVPAQALAILRDLQKRWGGEGTNEMTYYGSFDATPLFVRLVGRYVDAYGPAILQQTVRGKDGQERTLATCTRMATHWLVDKLNASSSGLLEYRRLNEDGLLNQTWKDSVNSYLFSDGTMANWDKGIASLELQGYAFDALTAAATHVAASPEEAAMLRERARDIQLDTLDKLWMEDEQFFAQGLDYDEHGNERQIDTLSSNAALLLESQLLLSLHPDIASPYIEAVVKMLCSDEFVTPYGLRCRALRHSTLPNGVGYHSSFAVWHKETIDAVKGLRKHGFTQAADTYAGTIVRTVVRQGEFYELNYVDEDNNLRTPEELVRLIGRELLEAEEVPVPEPGQAWSIAAFLSACRIIHDTRQEEAFGTLMEETLALKVETLTRV